MARGPHHDRNEWVHFFIGSPRRFVWTVLVLFIIFAMFFPNLATLALNNVLAVFISTLGPSAGPLLSIAIAIWAIWYVILRPFTSKKKKGDH